MTDVAIEVTIADGAKASAPTPRVIVTHGPGWFAGGFRQAYARFQQADSTLPVEVFYALFECLSWAVAAGELIPELGLETAEPKVRGLRYARIRVHHHWTDAVRFDETSGEWRWKSEPSLPDVALRYADPEGKAAYVAELESQPVAEALSVVTRLLQDYADVS